MLTKSVVPQSLATPGLIEFLPESRTFFLQGPSSTYALGIHKLGHVMHLHWGGKIAAEDIGYLNPGSRRAFCPTPCTEDYDFSPDIVPSEYPVFGRGDFRSPALEVLQSNGSRCIDLPYVSHEIIAGKPALPGLPSTYVESDSEAATLILHLADPLTGLEVDLLYTVYAQWDVITRSTRITNPGHAVAAVTLARALSVSVDFLTSDYDLLQLSGAWARERHIERTPLRSGVQSVDARRGVSSHNQNPFIALLTPGADEDQGEVRGFSLVYSGNFLAQADVDNYGSTRVSLGINPFEFSWELTPGSVFQTPEAVMVYSAAGLGDMSNTYHELYRTRLCRGKFRDDTRSILVNNWEATYFKFDAERIEALAVSASKVGIELLVLDDGWFGKRNQDDSSLGDWMVDLKKLPKGLPDLVQRVNAQGLQFGLWFEPEMISPDSDLYRQHPDWCLHVPERSRTVARNQLVLDFSRQDVVDYILASMSAILRSAPITYVKWDMNRSLTEVGSALLPAGRQRETSHRFVLNLYRLMEALVTEFPHVLFEGCSGGGGRFDPGILYYMPQIWTSDNTDAVCRLKIQYGTSLVYPLSSMGSHVSACPNHQVHRTTPMEFRGHVAMAGNLGYELDLGELPEEEARIVAQQVAFYKRTRGLIQTGRFYRLINPFEGSGNAAWMIVSQDKSLAIVFYYRVLAEPNIPFIRLRLKGLDLGRKYVVHTSAGSGKERDSSGHDIDDHAHKLPDVVRSSSVLQELGLMVVPEHGDFRSQVWELEVVP